MEKDKKTSAIYFLIIYLIAWLCLGAYFFIFIQGGNTFLTPGKNMKLEYLLAMNVLLPVSLILSGLIAEKLITVALLKRYINSSKNSNQIGLVPLKILTQKEFQKKIFWRMIILSFFMGNISITLANQNMIVNIYRINSAASSFLPDPEVFYHLLWIVAIPTVIIIVPLWLIMDIGLVKSKNEVGVEFHSVNLVFTPTYRIIKGFAGIGFVYSYVLMIIYWFLPELDSIIGKGAIDGIIRLTSPFFLIIMVFPIVYYVESRKDKFLAKAIKILKKLDKYNAIKCTIETNKLK